MNAKFGYGLPLTDICIEVIKAKSQTDHPDDSKKLILLPGPNLKSTIAFTANKNNGTVGFGSAAVVTADFIPHIKKFIDNQLIIVEDYDPSKRKAVQPDPYTKVTDLYYGEHKVAVKDCTNIIQESPKDVLRRILSSYEFDSLCNQHGLTCTSYNYEDVRQWALIHTDSLHVTGEFEMISMSDHYDRNAVNKNIDIVLSLLRKQIEDCTGTEIKLIVDMDYGWYLMWSEEFH